MRVLIDTLFNIFDIIRRFDSRHVVRVNCAGGRSFWPSKGGRAFGDLEDVRRQRRIQGRDKEVQPGAGKCRRVFGFSHQVTKKTATAAKPVTTDILNITDSESSKPPRILLREI